MQTWLLARIDWDRIRRFGSLSKRPLEWRCPSLEAVAVPLAGCYDGFE